MTCKHLEASTEAYETANGRERRIIRYLCGWGDEHVQEVKAMPSWLAREARSGGGFFDRDKHCPGCKAFVAYDFTDYLEGANEHGSKAQA